MTEEFLRDKHGRIKVEAGPIPAPVEAERILLGGDIFSVEDLLPQGRDLLSHIVGFLATSFGLPIVQLRDDPLTQSVWLDYCPPPRGWQYEGTATKPKVTTTFMIPHEVIVDSRAERMLVMAINKQIYGRTQGKRR